MSRLKTIGAELVGLFVDDWWFTVVTVGWLTVGVLLLPALLAGSAWSGPVLFSGCAVILAGSTLLAGWARVGKG